MRFFESLLTEAQLSDIYTKFYAKDFTEDDYYKIVQSDPTFDSNRPQKMGKYGKWLLTNAKLGKLKIEDLYKTTESLQAFHKFNSRLEIKDISKYKSPDELYDAVKEYINSDEPVSNKERKHAGVEHVYEDDEWQVVIPKTHEASVYYGRGTRWCTAMKDDDTFFNSYTADGPLYINIRKSDGAKFQFHFPSESFMDAEDKPIYGTIYDEIGLNDDILEFYENINPEYKEELIHDRYDEDEEIQDETILDNDVVRVLYNEGAYEIYIDYKDDDVESYTLSTYSGKLTNDSNLEEVKEPVAEILGRDVIKVLEDYLTDNEFYRLVLGLHFIDDIEDVYYKLDDDYILCYLKDNDEAILYFCDYDSYQCEEIINFKGDDMSVVFDSMRTEDLLGIKYLKIENADGLVNAYDINKEDFVFETWFKDIQSQKMDKVVIGLPENTGESMVIYDDGKIFEVPVPDDEVVINAQYYKKLDCLLVNCGDDIRKPSEKRNMRLYVYSFKFGDYINDKPYNNMNNVHKTDSSDKINKNVGLAMNDNNEKKLNYGRILYDYTNDDEEQVSEFVREYGFVMLMNPDSDAPVIMKDEVMTRREFFESVGAYDICKKVYSEFFGS